jgi:hypothetical protein
MLRRSRLALIASALTIAATLAAPLAWAGGPPSFAFQRPDTKTKQTAASPVLIVHAFSCHQPTDAAVSAHAEGIVKGERRTVALKLQPTGETGVYNVTRQWPAEGSWALVFSVDRGGRTTALVRLDAKGEPTFDSDQVAESSVRTLPREAKPADIETVLLAKAAK